MRRRTSRGTSRRCDATDRLHRTNDRLGRDAGQHHKNIGETIMAETLAKPGHNAGDPATYAQLFKSFFRIEDDKNSLRQRMRTEIGELSEQQARRGESTPPARPSRTAPPSLRSRLTAQAGGMRE